MYTSIFNLDLNLACACTDGSGPCILLFRFILKTVMLRKRYLQRLEYYLSDQESLIRRATAAVAAAAGWAASAVLGDGGDRISGRLVVMIVVQVTRNRTNYDRRHL